MSACQDLFMRQHADAVPGGHAHSFKRLPRKERVLALRLRVFPSVRLRGSQRVFAALLTPAFVCCAEERHALRRLLSVMHDIDRS